jgi:hypothetical protein
MTGQHGAADVNAFCLAKIRAGNQADCYSNRQGFESAGLMKNRKFRAPAEHCGGQVVHTFSYFCFTDAAHIPMALRTNQDCY